MIWVFDPKLQAKVRGILLLTSVSRASNLEHALSDSFKTYIPDIKISTSLSIRETVVADMNSDWTMSMVSYSEF
jgi:hypothetical protein